MKKTILFLAVLTLSSFVMSAQTIFGKWKTIDDKTGKAKSIVHVYQEGGKAYARIVELLNKEKKNMLCTECKGRKKNQKVEGMIIIEGLKQDGKEWNGGTILDPANGKEYKCYIELDSADKLKVRGFIGISLLGRTQYWHRVK